MDRPDRINLKEIASRTGASVATVSRALREDGPPSSAKRRRIREVAEELGYRPNLLVRGMQTGRTMTVGLLMGVGNGFEAKIFQGINEVLAPRGYVSLVLPPDASRPEREQIHELLDRRVDGIIVLPGRDAMWHVHVDEALERRVPVVSVDVQVQKGNAPIDFVGTDDSGVGATAARHLLELGHRHLGVLMSGQFPQPMHFRRLGFEEAAAAHGGAHCTCAVHPSGLGLSGYETARTFLEDENRPTGLFVVMDHLARGVYQAARELGLRIPQDLSVVGCADLDFTTALWPALTTVRQFPTEIGRKAAAMLHERMVRDCSDLPTRSLRLPGELVVRGSTAAAPVHKSTNQS